LTLVQRRILAPLLVPPALSQHQLTRFRRQENAEGGTQSVECHRSLTPLTPIGSIGRQLRQTIAGIRHHTFGLLLPEPRGLYQLYQLTPGCGLLRVPCRQYRHIFWIYRTPNTINHRPTGYLLLCEHCYTFADE
jgi:hypothetical protein